MDKRLQLVILQHGSQIITYVTPGKLTLRPSRVVASASGTEIGTITFSPLPSYPPLGKKKDNLLKFPSDCPETSERVQQLLTEVTRDTCDSMVKFLSQNVRWKPISYSAARPSPQDRDPLACHCGGGLGAIIDPIMGECAARRSRLGESEEIGDHSSQSDSICDPSQSE